MLTAGGEIGYHCGGSLINQRYVVTGNFNSSLDFHSGHGKIFFSAAHCVSKTPSDWILSQVRLGEWNLTQDIDCDPNDPRVCAPPVQNIGVVGKSSHPDYNPQSRNTLNDIALLRLARKVRLNNYVMPICLPLDSALFDYDYTGQTLSAAGWGEYNKSLIERLKFKCEINCRKNRRFTKKWR